MLLVSYAHKSGFGHAFITLSDERYPNNKADVELIVEYISEFSGYDRVCILNIMQLRRWWEFWK